MQADVPAFMFVGLAVLLPGEAAVQHNDRLAVISQKHEPADAGWQVLHNNPRFFHRHHPHYTIVPGAMREIFVIIRRALQGCGRPSES